MTYSNHKQNNFVLLSNINFNKVKAQVTYILKNQIIIAKENLESVEFKVKNLNNKVIVLWIYLMIH